MIEILVNQKNTEGVRYSFDRGTITIGRSPDNEIHLNSTAVSDKHARISLVENNCLIQKLESADLLLVNDKEVQRARLYNQDVIRIGHYALTVLSDNLTRFADSMAAGRTRTTMAPVDADQNNNPAAKEIEPAAATTDTANSGVSDPTTPTEPSPQPNLLSTGIDVLTGPAQGKRICFTGQSAKLGLKDEAVVVIKPLQGGYVVFASNKYLVVTLNGKPMQEKPMPLTDGDLIEYTNIRSRFFIETE
ncbi:FHA domain-containing protein [Gammaproteobacteria bacterium]|nr:FHA domain-containing protein [Gammaproteobacteria bacterium]